jgi:hypothetical protein
MHDGEIAAFQGRASREHLKGIDLGHHGDDGGLLLVLRPVREHADTDAADPVLDAGAVTKLVQDLQRVVHERVGEIDKAEAAPRAPEALGAGRNAFAPRRRGGMRVAEH